MRRYRRAYLRHHNEQQLVSLVKENIGSPKEPKLTHFISLFNLCKNQRGEKTAICCFTEGLRAWVFLSWEL